VAAAPWAARVRVPATSANLGPGYDCAGLALGCWDVLDVAVTGGGLTVVIEGPGAEELPTDESHLVVQAFRAACAELGWSPAGLRLLCRNGIPQGRGMGSSAAAVVAGIVAAWALCPDVQARDDTAVLRLATRLEGHPDNVAACLLGGATISWIGPDGFVADQLDLSDEVLPMVLVPPATLSTTVARGLLPAAVPHGAAAFTAGRAALLVHALTREPGLLLAATEDRLHQPYRAPAMPDTAALIGRLRDAGHAAVVSGAGPSVLVLGRWSPGDDRADPASSALARAVGDLTPGSWRRLPLPVDLHGAQVRALRMDHDEVSF
jgi:homoserine kinase